MKRRSFLARLVGGAVGAAVLSRLPVVVQERVRTAPGLTFRGIPIVFDQDCPSGTVYFISKESFFSYDGRFWRPVVPAPPEKPLARINRIS